MRARMIDTFGLSGTKERFVTHLQKETIPAIQEQEGYRGMLVLGDRRSEHVIIATFWDSRTEERTSAHSAVFEQQLRAAAPYIDLRITHEEFDVLLAAWQDGDAPEGPPFDAADRPHSP